MAQTQNKPPFITLSLKEFLVILSISFVSYTIDAILSIRSNRAETMFILNTSKKELEITKKIQLNKSKLAKRRQELEKLKQLLKSKTLQLKK